MPSTPETLKTDVLIVGAGAAGMMCAIEAAKRGRRVVVLERQDRIGKKILISGGGRCNFTNLYSKPENFLSRNEHFYKSALARYPPSAFIAWVEKHNIPYFEKKLGQLFCKVSAKQITGMLLEECHRTGVEILLSREISRVQRLTSGPFRLETNQGVLESPILVIATGGLSYPKLGATDFGYRIAEQFGLKVLPPIPALVPLLWNPEDLRRFQDFSGVSFNGVATCQGKSFHEDILFTHRGLSGPAILQISSYWNPGDSITIDLLPQFSGEGFLLQAKTEGGKSLLKNYLAQYLPKRLAEYWGDHVAPSRPIREISDLALRDIARSLYRWEIFPEATEGYETAEVTRGGIDTEELSSKTLESKKIPGLYFIGEVVDVTGHLGGHNFQWAWASGYAAGQAI